MYDDKKLILQLDTGGWNPLKVLWPLLGKVLSLAATQQLGERRALSVQGAEIKVVYQQLLNNRNSSKEKMDWHFSVEINTSLYQTLSNCAKKQNQDTAAQYWVSRDLPLSHSFQGKKKRKEESEESTAMAASKMRTRHRSHLFSKGGKVFISSY